MAGFQENVIRRELSVRGVQFLYFCTFSLQIFFAKKIYDNVEIHGFQKEI